MKEFVPSQNFVRKVMQAVRECDAQEVNRTGIAGNLLSLRPIRITLSAGAVTIAIFNLIRIFLTFLSPTLCR